MGRAGDNTHPAPGQGWGGASWEIINFDFSALVLDKSKKSKGGKLRQPKLDSNFPNSPFLAQVNTKYGAITFTVHYEVGFFERKKT